MSRISVIDLSQLGPMQVIETIDSDAIVDARMADLKLKWAQHDPPAAAQYDVEHLEFDPVKINQEVSAYFETLLRDRVNQAARAVTTAFGTGPDLDAIATRYPGGVPRLAVVPDPRPYEEHPEDWEADDRYRRRIVLSPNTLSPHGTYEAYVFWAMTADPTLRDATAVERPGTGEITLTCMAEGVDPRPTTEQLLAVRRYILSESRKGLTDIIAVVAPTVIDTDYQIELWFYPGPDMTLLKSRVDQSLLALVERQRWLGQDHTLTSIHGACNLPGVHHAVILVPAKDLLVTPSMVVKVNRIITRPVGRAE